MRTLRRDRPIFTSDAILIRHFFRDELVKTVAINLTTGSVIAEVRISREFLPSFSLTGPRSVARSVAADVASGFFATYLSFSSKRDVDREGEIKVMSAAAAAVAVADAAGGRSIS